MLAHNVHRLSAVLIFCISCARNICRLEVLMMKLQIMSVPLLVLRRQFVFAPPSKNVKASNFLNR